MRHEFPTEWARFQSQSPPPNHRFELALNLLPEHYPFWSQGRLNGVTRVDILARSTQAPIPGGVDIADNADKNDTTAKKDTLTQDSSLGNLLVGELEDIALPESPIGELKIFFDDKAIADLWVGVTWNA